VKKIISSFGPTQIKDILLWVNHMREQRNLPALSDLPKGLPSSRQCPLGKALSTDEQPVIIASWGWTEPQSKDTPEDERLPSKWHEVPPCVADFCRRFDSGTAFQEYKDV
jgi:hypothetical protein